MPATCRRSTTPNAHSATSRRASCEFDASILGAHTIPDTVAGVPGLNFTLTKVTRRRPARSPTVTFTVKDNAGNRIPMSTFPPARGSLSLTMAGPTTDYGYTSFGSDVTTPGYVTESIAATASCDGDGTCSLHLQPR